MVYWLAPMTWSCLGLLTWAVFNRIDGILLTTSKFGKRRPGYEELTQWFEPLRNGKYFECINCQFWSTVSNVINLFFLNLISVFNCFSLHCSQLLTAYIRLPNSHGFPIKIVLQIW